MRGSYTVSLAIAVAILFPVSGFAQGGISQTYLDFSIMGGGARAAGMGGAYLGLADGEMSYSWNPAGMLYNDKTKFGIQLASVADKFTSAVIDTSDLYPEPNIQPVEVKKNHFSLNYGGFAVPFEFLERDWAVGGGFRNVFDMIREYSYPGFNGTQNSYTQDRGIDAASGSIAARIIDRVALGLTVNSYLRNSELNYYRGASFQYVSPNQIDTSIIDTWVNSNSHYSGANVDVGLSADFGIVRGGFVFHSSYSLIQNEKQTYSFIIPPEPIGLVDRIKYKYSMPSAFSAGIAVLPVEKLIIALDYSKRDLSSVDIEIDYEQALFIDTTVSAEWADISQFRVGAEYSLDAGFADIPVRVGFRNEPSAAKEITAYNYNAADSTWTDEVGDQISTNIISFGTGLRFERAWIDLAYQFGSSSYNRTVNYLTPQVFEIKRDYSRLIMSVGMYF